jgi:hypothetical protein
MLGGGTTEAPRQIGQGKAEAVEENDKA